MGSCYGQRQNITVTGLNSPEPNWNRTNIFIDEALPCIIKGSKKNKALRKPILEKLMMRNYQKKECIKEFLETHSF